MVKGNLVWLEKINPAHDIAEHIDPIHHALGELVRQSSDSQCQKTQHKVAENPVPVLKLFNVAQRKPEPCRGRRQVRGEGLYLYQNQSL